MKKRVLKIAILAIMIVFAYVTVVNALSFTATMTPSATTVPEATEFTISVKISNLDVGTNGINSMSGYLKYDKSVFEEINESSIDGISGWNATYNPDGGKITLTKATFVKSEEEVMSITFKTKAGTKDAKPGKIEFINIVASNSETSISAADVSTEITIGTEDSNQGNTSATNSNGNGSISIKPTNNTTSNKADNKTINAISSKNNTANGTTSNSTNKTSNTVKNSVGNVSTNEAAKDEIPYTGVEDTVMYIIAAVVLVAIVFYIKFERINKEIK